MAFNKDGDGRVGRLVEQLPVLHCMMWIDVCFIPVHTNGRTLNKFMEKLVLPNTQLFHAAIMCNLLKC